MVHPKVKILDSVETFVFPRGGKVTPIMRVRWMYGEDHGPYTTDLPLADFSWTAFETAIQARVSDLAAHGF